jgi:hypothetical protein
VSEANPVLVVESSNFTISESGRPWIGCVSALTGFSEYADRIVRGCSGERHVVPEPDQRALQILRDNPFVVREE